MSTEPPTGSRTREPLTRERVLQGAVEYADEHGIGGLSMRNLARHLGFEAMSLYNHVAGKDDLLEAMVEHVAAEIETPDPGLDWKEGIRSMSESTHDALLRHPWVVDLWLRVFPGPNRFRLMEQLLRLLEVGGFDGYLADLAFHAVNLHVNGFTQQQLGYRMDDDARHAMEIRFEREVSVDQYPRVVAHKQYHDDVDARRAEHPDEFAYVLDLILDGLERARDAGVAVDRTAWESGAHRQ